AWGVQSGFLVPLDAGARLPLPAGFRPDVAVGGLLAGARLPDHDLLLVDAATGRIQAHLGNVVLMALGHRFVLWTDCAPAFHRPCTVHRAAVTGGHAARYRLPPGAGCCGVLSPDDRLLAFPLQRTIGVLHLDTGRLEIVPGIDMPEDSVGP